VPAGDLVLGGELLVPAGDLVLGGELLVPAGDLVLGGELLVPAGSVLWSGAKFSPGKTCVTAQLVTLGQPFGAVIVGIGVNQWWRCPCVIALHYTVTYTLLAGIPNTGTVNEGACPAPVLKGNLAAPFPNVVAFVATGSDSIFVMVSSAGVVSCSYKVVITSP
jgi:hypothetical protein